MSIYFFFNDTATTEIYTLSLHDALPISAHAHVVSPSTQRRTSEAESSTHPGRCAHTSAMRSRPSAAQSADRKSTRLNSSHANISYAVFCLKKKNKIIDTKIPDNY